eukprot:jgi/Mesen1/10735/ME000090S10194
MSFLFRNLFRGQVTPKQKRHHFSPPKSTSENLCILLQRMRVYLLVCIIIVLGVLAVLTIATDHAANFNSHFNKEANLLSQAVLDQPTYSSQRKTSEDPSISRKTLLPRGADNAKELTVGREVSPASLSAIGKNFKASNTKDKAGAEEHAASEIKSTGSHTRMAGVAITTGTEKDPPSDSSKKQSSGNTPLSVYAYNLPVKYNWGILGDHEKPWEILDLLVVQGPGIDAHDPFPEPGDKRWGWPADRPANGSLVLPGNAKHPLILQYSAEYYLMLALFTGLPSVTRTLDPAAADVMLVPAFSSLAYSFYVGSNPRRVDKDQELQEGLLSWLQEQPTWRASSGCKHVVAAFHPHSLEHSLGALANATLLVADFWRPSPAGRAATSVLKDVVAPYHALLEPYSTPPSNNTRSAGGWAERPTLLYFRGGTKRKRRGAIRGQMLDLFQGEPGVVYEEGASWEDGALTTAAAGMRRSKFCLSPTGDTPSSCRLFDAIVSHCVPVVVSDRIELPYEDVLDYTRFAVFVSEETALKPGRLVALLRAVPVRQWNAMWRRLKHVDRHFKYSVPAKPGGAEDMIWQSIARRALLGPPDARFRKKRLAQMKNPAAAISVTRTQG